MNFKPANFIFAGLFVFIDAFNSANND